MIIKILTYPSAMTLRMVAAVAVDETEKLTTIALELDLANS